MKEEKEKMRKKFFVKVQRRKKIISRQSQKRIRLTQAMLAKRLSLIWTIARRSSLIWPKYPKRKRRARLKIRK